MCPVGPGDTAVRKCVLPDTVEVDVTQNSDYAEACCACVTNDSQHSLKLLEALNLPASKLKSAEVDKLTALLLEFSDVFALDESELGRTKIVRHSIYRTPIVRRETIKKMRCRDKA